MNTDKKEESHRLPSLLRNWTSLIGMVIGMVAASAGFLALVGGLAAIPAGVALYRFLFDLLSNLGGNSTPPQLYDVYAPWELIAMPLAGVIVAVGAAMVPGRWAAMTNVAEVLHAE